MSLITGGAAERIEARVAALLAGNNQFTGENTFTGQNAFTTVQHMNRIWLGGVGDPTAAQLRIENQAGDPEERSYRLEVRNDGQLRLVAENELYQSVESALQVMRDGTTIERATVITDSASLNVGDGSGTVGVRADGLIMMNTSSSMQLESDELDLSGTFTVTSRVGQLMVVSRSIALTGGPGAGGAVMTLGPLPEGLRPNLDINAVCTAVNGGVSVLAHALVKTTGVIEFRLGLMAGPPGDEWLSFTGARDWQGVHGLPAGFCLFFRM